MKLCCPSGSARRVTSTPASRASLGEVDGLTGEDFLVAVVDEGRRQSGEIGMGQIDPSPGRVGANPKMVGLLREASILSLWRVQPTVQIW
jgi:hypothetical protein